MKAFPSHDDWPRRQLRSPFGRFLSPTVPLASFVLSLPLLSITLPLLGQPCPDPWVLTDERRRDFLHYYSPVILKTGDENNKHRHLGHDWITSFAFDNDLDFANNQHNWRYEKIHFIENTRNLDWKISPTLYTALIEFMSPCQPSGERTKNLVLIYHVYHAYQGGRNAIKLRSHDVHDWERIELRLDDVQPRGAGRGERVNYYVITRHKHHDGRLRGHAGLRFLEIDPITGARLGKHVLISQQRWNGDWPGRRKAQLHYVLDDLGEIKPAMVRISGGYLFPTPYHYIFVDGQAEALTLLLGAEEITADNAGELASGWDDDKTVAMTATKRISYELRDLASILPTHWEHSAGTQENLNWSGKKTYRIDLTEDISGTVGGRTTTVSAGPRTFFLKSRVVTKKNKRKNGARKGLLAKNWFWGPYQWNKKDHDGWLRKEYKKRGKVWSQHDYFAHDPGPEGKARRGDWLPENWHLPDQGGFDGRWIELFPEREESPPPPSDPPIEPLCPPRTRCCPAVSNCLRCVPVGEECNGGPPSAATAYR